MRRRIPAILLAAALCPGPLAALSVVPFEELAPPDLFEGTSERIALSPVSVSFQCVDCAGGYPTVDLNLHGGADWASELSAILADGRVQEHNLTDHCKRADPECDPVAVDYAGRLAVRMTRRYGPSEADLVTAILWLPLDDDVLIVSALAGTRAEADALLDRALSDFVPSVLQP